MNDGWNSLGHFYMSSDTSKVRKNIVVNALSRRYILISTLDAKLIGFEKIKELYPLDHNFCEEFQACEKNVVGKFFRHEGFLFRENKLCVLNCSLCDLLIRESHGRRDTLEFVRL